MRCLVSAGGFLSAFAVAASLSQAQQPKASPAAPKSLLLYYGYPSVINGSKGNVAAAAKHFAPYDFVVLGAGLESPKHEDHAKTVAIIQGARKTQFFGYVDLGVTTNNHPIKALTEMLQGWSKMGVKGVLLDDFGFDFKVDRERQNAAVSAAHKLRLQVIANAWNPEDAFGVIGGKAPALTKDDIYLWESYRFQEGKPVAIEAWRKKADAIAALRQKTPFSVFSVSTTKGEIDKRDEWFAHQWYCAAIDGHAATGWGHQGFAAAGDAPLTIVAPKQDLGTQVIGVVTVGGFQVTRPTSLGVIEADTDALTGSFKVVPPKKK